VDDGDVTDGVGVCTSGRARTGTDRWFKTKMAKVGSVLGNGTKQRGISVGVSLD
jgi:hypothetical protein